MSQIDYEKNDMIIVMKVLLLWGAIDALCL